MTTANIDKMFINVLKGNVLKQERKNCILFEKERSNSYLLLYAGLFVFSKAIAMVLNVLFLIFFTCAQGTQLCQCRVTIKVSEQNLIVRGLR